ncbi:unnamed protein product [Effrenium voratum]|nr:unnamed protein product [Effrenium voratum]
MAVESLSRSLACNSCVHAAILRESWWHELAVPAASGEAPTQEAKLFWSEFQARYPEGAERVQQQVEKEHAEKRRAQGGLGELREACRTFFKSVSHEGLLEVCARLDYASTEAQELCYEPRAGQYVVKGSGGLWPVELEALPFAALGQRLQDLVAAYEIDGIGSTEAVWLQPMIWQASFLPLAVLVEAWSRATGLPALFYMDAFHGLLLGLLHKDITTDVAGFKCRSRYWAVGTAQPGSGKSPAVDPMVEALQEVLEQHPDLAAGEAWDKFHICDPKTHCATVDKLRDADGYLTVVAGEGGPLLCPSWPSSATWNQTTHVNLQRFLNSANGGSVPWENAIERKGKKQAMEEQVRASPNVPGDRTNVSIVLFQQCSVFSNWWAAGELKQAIGLPQRCVFSFGAVREPGPPWLQGFESEVVIPLLKRGFLWILKTLGPKAPLSDRTPGLSWRLGSVCRDVFWR